jgi:hypothetical protein
MICRCEVLWGRVGPHKTGDKLDLSEADADRLHKMGAVRVLFKISSQPEFVAAKTSETHSPEVPEAPREQEDTPEPEANEAPAPRRERKSKK